MKIYKSYVEMLRINHWFKNSFILAGVIVGIWYSQTFSFSSAFIGRLFLAFFLTSAVSSSNYIINQIADKDFDAKHPTKKHRPLPSGKIAPASAWQYAGLIFLISLILANLFLSIYFSFTLVLFFIAGILYNLRPIRFLYSLAK